MMPPQLPRSLYSIERRTGGFPFMPKRPLARAQRTAPTPAVQDNSFGLVRLGMTQRQAVRVAGL
jgi:hypothetical protein